jgi:predicted membrane protein
MTKSILQKNSLASRSLLIGFLTLFGFLWNSPAFASVTV